MKRMDAGPRERLLSTTLAWPEIQVNNLFNKRRPLKTAMMLPPRANAFVSPRQDTDSDREIIGGNAQRTGHG